MSKKARTRAKIALVIFVAAVCAGVLLLEFTPAGREVLNRWAYSLYKADDSVSYQTLKEVEDSCRAMQASYESDRLAYYQYAKGSDEERKWAAAAKTRANKTAAMYNQYVLKNSFVWEGNVPKDILRELEYIEEDTK